MADDPQNLKTTIKDYLMREFLPGEDADDLTDATPLVTSGILDSISTFKLVGFLQSTYGVKLNANEIAHHLDTINDIADIIQAKQGAV